MLATRYPLLATFFPSHFLTFALWTALCLAFAAAPLAAQQQQQGQCARVKIEIVQQLTIERVGFEATLEVTNNDGGDPITDFFAALTFEDPTLSSDTVTNDASSLFFVQNPRLENISSVDGNGVIGPTKTATTRWFIIPKPSAGGTEPQGKAYRVGVRMSGKQLGQPLPDSVLFAIPDTITVRPEPLLDITYFQPRDVQGDDPFTPEVESPIPFTLGVLVKNSGFAPARNITINSQQPKIVENRQGLLLVARLLGTRVMDSPLNESSLLVDLGTINPGNARKGAWDMITSLSGEFIEFKASYTHASELGGRDTSLIHSLDAHFIARECLVDLPGRDNVKDFLADTDRDPDMIPDAIYESEGNILPVNQITGAVITQPLANRKFRFSVLANKADWVYLRMDDPGQARLAIEKVVRLNDGKIINLRNVWTNVRYRRPDNFKYTYFNLLDLATAGTTYEYEVTYAAPAVDTTPPETRLRFSGDVTESGGKFYITRQTQLFFTSEDVNPVSIFYKLGSGSYIAGLPFFLTTPGEYLISYYAQDTAGNSETPKLAVVVVPGSGPSIPSLNTSAPTVTLAGDTLSVRSSSSTISATIGASPYPVTAKIDIFQGLQSSPALTGVPVSPTPLGTATLTVGGVFVDFYRYSVNGAAFSAEAPVSTPITLTGLSGSVTLRVLGRSLSGSYPPDTAALQAQWTVSASAPEITLTGIGATPTRFGDAVVQVGGPGIELYRWRPAGSFFRAEAPPTTPITLSGLEPGQQTIEVIVRKNGVWQDQAAASSFTWLYAPNYGFDFTGLPIVRTAEFPAAQGTTVNFAWNGLNGSGVAVAPGWYIVRVLATDSLGKVFSTAQLVKIEDLLGTRTLLVDGAQGPRRPHARHGFLVWQQNNTGSWNIQARTVGGSLGAPFAVTTGTLDQENPRTDGRYAVWQSRQTNGGWDIRYANLSTAGTPLPVTDTPNRDEINPAIDWPWVVYQSRPTDVANAPWQLEARNLQTGAVVKPLLSTQDMLTPAVADGRVVWQDFRDVGFGEIYYANLETGETRRITNNPGGQYLPDIGGHWVVWQDNRHGQNEIYGFDLLRGAEVRLTNSPENEAHPVLNGNWVLFEDDSAAVNTANFRILDLVTRKSAPLTRTMEQKAAGTLSSGLLFYQGDESGLAVLRTASLPALQPVFINNNAVPVTAAMASRYGNAFALLAAWQAQAGVVAVSKYSSLVPVPVKQTATWTGTAAAGENFTLAQGDFLWLQFPAFGVLDLGPASGRTVNLSAGTNVLGYDSFPNGTTLHGLVRSLGLGHVISVRMLDANTGSWQTVTVQGGAILGADHAVPEVAVVLLDLKDPLLNWKP